MQNIKDIFISTWVTEYMCEKTAAIASSSLVLLPELVNLVSGDDGSRSTIFLRVISSCVIGMMMTALRSQG